MKPLHYAVATCLAMAVTTLPAIADCVRQSPAEEIASAPCSASKRSCEVWRQFRAAHPVPYQTLAVSLGEEHDAVVIISEPPPIMPPQEIASLAAAVFADLSPTIERLRFPIGYDGWLEDVVIHLQVDGDLASFPNANGGIAEIPSTLANRLQYLYAALFGSVEDFYLDLIEPGSGFKPVRLPELKITGTDLRNIVADAQRKWLPLDRPTENALSWADVEKHTKAASFTDDSNSVIVLFIPRQADLEATRQAFRRFAISSDFLLGGLRPKRGGLALFGRNRLTPLAVLPPLRFETVASFARTPGQPLGQSYERQRVLAGKITTGQRAAWDWAPIYLSPQLQDTEFGILLDLADQELKSWSERGNVRYAGFAYPDPNEFPFGERPVSAWLAENAFTSSLIFNWNTSGFSTAVDDTLGRLISASSTAALPVSYIAQLEHEPDFVGKLRALRGIDPADSAATASNTGTRYFAALGDPILVRVVQNVFLYQMISETTPFRAAATAAALSSPRASATTKILVEETLRWLREESAGEQNDDDLGALIRQSGMTIPQLAELLAAPELSTRAFVRARSILELNERALRALYERASSVESELTVVDQKRLAEFMARCKELGGTIKSGRAGYTECTYATSNGQEASFPTSYDERSKKLAAELEALGQQIKAAEASAEQAWKELQRIGRQLQAADRVAGDLRSRSSFSEDLDRVLANVIAATSANPSAGSIQTPSVVLSCNVAEEMSVGGHNIDALPWRVERGSAKAKPILRTTGNQTTLTLPSAQTGQSTEIARRIVEQAPEAPIAPERPLREALGMASERSSGTFLEELRSRQEALPTIDADFLTRANECHCDVYVERAAGDISLIAQLGPPPSAQAVFGSSRLIEKLAEGKSPRRILFAGFDGQQVDAVAYGAARRAAAADPHKGVIQEALYRTKDLFRRAVDSSVSMLSLRTKKGTVARVGLATDVRPDRGRLIEMLSQRPSWHGTKVISGPEGGGLFEVVLPPQQTPKSSDVFSISIRADEGSLPVSQLEAGVKNVVVGFSAARPNVEDAIIRLTEQLEREVKIRELEFFLKDVDSQTLARLLLKTPQNEPFEAIVGK